MNPLIPPPENIPVAWGWLKGLLMAVFPLHLLFMNAMLGSAIIALYAGMRNDETSQRLSGRLAAIIPFIVAFAVNFGVVSLLFIQVLFGGLFYTSSILMAPFWLSVIPLLLTAYYLLYIYDFRYASLGKWRVLIAVFAVSIFLLIAFFLSNNMTLMLDPGKWQRYLIEQAGTFLNLGEATLWPRYLHFMIGGTAIGGLFVALYGKILSKRENLLGDKAVVVGMRTFIVLSCVQILDGLWFLQSLPGDIRTGFMGGDTFSTALLFTGVFLALVAVMTAAMKNVYLTACMAIPLVYVMAFIRDHVRSAHINPFFSPDTPTPVPHYSPMVMFFCLFPAAVAVVMWMLYKGWQCRRQDPEKS